MQNYLITSSDNIVTSTDSLITSPDNLIVVPSYLEITLSSKCLQSGSSGTGAIKVIFSLVVGCSKLSSLA